jgi:hypothetical protein
METEGDGAGEVAATVPPTTAVASESAPIPGYTSFSIVTDLTRVAVPIFSFHFSSNYMFRGCGWNR